MVDINFQSYFMLEFALDLDSPDDTTILERYLASNPRELSGAERRFLEELRASFIAPYEVVAVEPGKGMRLSNLWIPGEAWVSERTASKSVQRWDLLAARVMRRPSGEHVLQGSLFPFPADSKSRLLERLEAEHRSRSLSCPALTPDAFLRELSPCYHTLWLESGPLRAAPELATFDGEPIQPVKARFTIRDETRLRAALGQEPEVWGENDDGWIYYRSLGGIRHAMAWLHIHEGGLLLVDSLTEKHMAEVCERLVRTAGALLSLVETRNLGVEEFLRDRTSAPPAPQASASKRAKQLQFRALDDHYRRWLDEKIPALDGRTPREASVDERLRPRLVQILKEMENQEARAPATGGRPYDLERLWQVLALERPEHSTTVDRYPYLVADLRHYLDGGGFTRRISREVRTLALYLGRIVAHAAHDRRNETVRSDIDCRRRPDHQPCVGQILIRREADTDRVLWMCPACNDGGSIHGWGGTPFDPAARPRDPPVDGCLVRERVFIDSTELRALERLERLSGRALALVAHVVKEGERIALDGERSEFADLRDCIADARKSVAGLAEQRRLGWLHGIVSIAAGSGRGREVTPNPPPQRRPGGGAVSSSWFE